MKEHHHQVWDAQGLGIRQRATVQQWPNSGLVRPLRYTNQALSRVMAANQWPSWVRQQIVLKGIKKSLEAAKEVWVDDLPGVLWSARTTTKEATGHSPFGLVYESEAELPVEVGIPSPRMNFYELDKIKKKSPSTCTYCQKHGTMHCCDRFARNKELLGNSIVE